MTSKTAITDGVFSGSIWEPSLVPEPECSTSSGVLSATVPIYSGTFTAPNTTGKTTGVWVYFAAVPSGGRDFIVTLQEATVDTACTATIFAAQLSTLSIGWVYVRFPTPYQWTTTTANRYRFKFNLSISTSGNLALRAAGSTVGFLDTHDSPTTLGSTEDAWIGGLCGNGPVTPIAVTVTGTGNVCGDGSLKGSTGNNGTGRYSTGAVTISNGGTLNWDKTANATLQTRGWINVCNGGIYDRTGSDVDRTIVAKHIFDVETANGDYGFNGVGLLKMVSGDLPTHMVEYVSGVGTAASPLIVDTATNWKVNDTIIVSGDAYNQVERRYIKTVNSSTSFVLSTTAGGAETALTYSHSVGSTIVNSTRNSIAEPLVSTRSYYMNTHNATPHDFTGAWFNNPSLASGVGGIVFASTANNVFTADYAVISEGTSNRIGFQISTTKSVQTITGLIIDSLNSTNVGSGPLHLSSTANKTLVDCFIVEGTSMGLVLNAAYNCTFNNCRFNANNTAGGAGGLAVYMLNAGSNTFNDCRFDSQRIQAVYATGCSATIFNNCEFGTRGTNTVDILTVTDTSNDILFNNCEFGSATLLSNYENQLAGSLARFHNYQQDVNRHRWYTINGQGLSAGAGLDSTTVATSGSLGTTLKPATPEGLRFEYPFPVSVGEVISQFGKVWCNATALADSGVTITAELFLPGAITPIQAVNVTKTTDSTSNDAIFRLGSVNTSVEPSTAKVRITARNANATPGVEIYVDDINGGTNPISALDIWYEGQPLAFRLTPQTLGDAAAISTAVWNDAVVYPPGSKGGDVKLIKTLNLDKA